MSAAQKKELKLHDDINIVYDMKEKPNNTHLKAQKDRAVVANLRADLVLPSDKILTVDIDFDTTSGYHNNAIMVMDDFGLEMIALAFETKYGKQHAEQIRQAWANKKHSDSPRKPTYLLVQKPNNTEQLPKVFAACGDQDHDDDNKNPKSII
ncbi:MAG: hypothetical protein QF552_04785 [Litorilituus sp.]|jgi:hypothetical protein|nr:hypothetical protein [Litorilituus sp.]